MDKNKLIKNYVAIINGKEITVSAKRYAEALRVANGIAWREGIAATDNQGFDLREVRG